MNNEYEQPKVKGFSTDRIQWRFFGNLYTYLFIIYPFHQLSVAAHRNEKPRIGLVSHVCLVDQRCQITMAWMCFHIYVIDFAWKIHWKYIKIKCIVALHPFEIIYTKNICLVCVYVCLSVRRLKNSYIHWIEMK